MNRSWERVEIGIQDGADGRYWSHCSDIMKVYVSGLHVKWKLGGGEVHLTSISPPQPVKNCFFFGLSTPYRLCQSQKGHKELPKSPPCAAATSAPLLPSPHLPSWGAKITLKRPASLCRLSSCHLKKKKKAVRQAGETFQVCKSGQKKKKKKKDGVGVADPLPPNPTPVGQRPIAQKPRREQRESCVQRCWRGRERRRGCQKTAAESGNPARETECFLKPGKFGIISPIHLGKKPWVCEGEVIGPLEGSIRFKRTNQMCCCQFTVAATAWGFLPPQG